MHAAMQGKEQSIFVVDGLAFPNRMRIEIGVYYFVKSCAYLPQIQKTNLDYMFIDDRYRATKNGIKSSHKPEETRKLALRGEDADFDCFWVCSTTITRLHCFTVLIVHRQGNKPRTKQNPVFSIIVLIGAVFPAYRGKTGG